MLHVVSTEGHFSSAGALAFVLLTTRLPHTVAMRPAPAGSEEKYQFVTLKVLEKGESGIEYGRGVMLDRTWGNGLITSPTIDVLGSFCSFLRFDLFLYLTLLALLPVCSFFRYRNSLTLAKDSPYATPTQHSQPPCTPPTPNTLTLQHGSVPAARNSGPRTGKKRMWGRGMLCFLMMVCF